MSQVIFIKLCFFEIPNEIECLEFLIQIGNDEAPEFPQFGKNIIEIPQQLIGDKNSVIEVMEIFPKTYSQIIFWTPLF